MHQHDVIINWFKLYTKILKNYEILSKDTYNMNEKNFVMRLHDKHKIIYSKN